ncbi:hypothetical protein ACUUL3_16800 [Thiovibrio sp. JS02]
MKKMIYATIRKQSRRFGQAQFSPITKKQTPFPVEIDFDRDPFHPVLGGPGGKYALSDVNLYVMLPDNSGLAQIAIQSEKDDDSHLWIIASHRLEYGTD